MTELTDAKRRLIERLKRVESATAPELADAFGLTDTAVRQHLDVLELAGLVARSSEPPSGRGRPPLHWQLTPLAAGLFPDRHAELTVEVLLSVRDLLGEEALSTVIEARTERQLAHYRTELDEHAPLADRVERLAALRTAEGYLAESRPVEDAECGEDGSGAGHGPSGYSLVEHHCPICDAAAACGALCRSELDLFRSALGPGVEVERTHHLLSGDSRCTYIVRPVASPRSDHGED